ncbi:MAG: hypothetical protein Q9190_003906 [Brigantiaea leucoxantha]
MRASFAAAAGAAILMGTSALETTTSLIDGKLYLVEYYNDCSTITSGLATVTGTTGPSAGGPSGPLTTYVTVYPETCSTGLQMKTYTVTESCSNPGAPRPSDYIPQAFTVTTVTCHVCGETPLVATLTTPAPVAPSIPPAGSGPATVPAAPTGGSSPPGGAPAGAPPAAPPAAPAGSPPVAPAGSPAGSPSGAPPGAPPGAPAGAPAPPGAPAAPPVKAVPAPAESGAGNSPVGAAPAGGAPAAEAPAASGPSLGNSPPPAGGAAPAAPYYPTEGAPTGAVGVGGSNSSAITPFTGSASNLSPGSSLIASMICIIGLLRLAL